MVKQVLECLARLKSKFLVDHEARRMLSLELEEVKEKTTFLLADIPAPLSHLPAVLVQPTTPSEYNGDLTNGHSFLLYIGICKNKFPDKQTQIFWALSLMKRGRAANRQIQPLAGGHPSCLDVQAKEHH
jgi:hypothetical protein